MSINHITNTNIPIIHITDTNQTIAPTKIHEIAHEILQLLATTNERLANIERRLTSIENKQTELYTKVEQIRSAPPPPPPPPPPKTHEENNEPSVPREEREPNNTPTNKTSPNPQAAGVAGQLSEIFKESNNNPELEDKTFLPTSIRRAQSLRIKPKQSSNNADEDNKLSIKIKKCPLSPPSATSSLPKTHVENNENSTPKKESVTDIPILKEKPSNSQAEVSTEASEGLIAQISSESASILQGKTDVSTNGFQRKQPCCIKLPQKKTNEVDQQASFAAKRQIFERVKS